MKTALSLKLPDASYVTRSTGEDPTKREDAVVPVGYAAARAGLVETAVREQGEPRTTRKSGAGDARPRCGGHDAARGSRRSFARARSV